MSARSNADFSLAGKRIWVAGHRGMVGSAVCRRLANEDCDILTVDRTEVDLRRQNDTEEWLDSHRPDGVFLAAAKVGGIQANNTQPADFIYDNLALQTNVIHGAWKVGVEKLLFLGSSCVYPRLTNQPIVESALLSGPLEPTNQWYAVAKIAGIKMCQAYRRQYGVNFVVAQPTNLYGPNDNFEFTSSHVLPALIAKAHEAKEAGKDTLEIWGTGSPRREFLYVDDLADAIVFLMTRYSSELEINVGSNQELTIRELAELVAEVVGFRGRLAFDKSKPDGTPRKLLDSSRLLAMGWRAETGLRDGVAATYKSYLNSIACATSSAV